MDVLGWLGEHPLVAQCVREALRAGRATLRGSVGSSTPLIAGALARLSERPVLLVVAHVDEADEALDTLQSAGAACSLLPALQALAGETHVAAELLAARLGVVRDALAWRATAGAAAGRVIIAPIQALMQTVPAPASMDAALLELTKGDPRGPEAVVRWLTEAGYTRVEAVEEPGDFAVRGGILDVFPPGDPGASVSDSQGRAISAGGVPVRLDFFGNDIDAIAEIDLDTMGVDRSVHGVRFIRVTQEEAGEKSGASKPSPGVAFTDLLPEGTLAILHELLELTEQGRGYYERLTGAHDVLGPPAVFKGIQARCAAVIDITALGAYAGRDTGAASGAGGSAQAKASAAPVWTLPVGPPLALPDELPEAIKELARVADPPAGETAEPLRVTVFCQNAAEQLRFHELLSEHLAPIPPEIAGGSAESAESRATHAEQASARPRPARVASQVQYLHAGFLWRDERTGPHLLLPYHELLKRFMARRARGLGGGGRLKAGRAMDTFLDLQVGDYVVHADHGIAQFTGLRFVRPQDEAASIDERLQGRRATKPSQGDAEEFLTLEFAGGSKLHVPATKVDLVTKYVGGFRGKPPLSTLGGDRWKNQKARVAESVRDLASELLRVRAAREHLPGVRFPGDTAWQKEFEDEFPYDETEDQLAALAEIKRDMQSPRPMDRLLCGDVGYGKTELAIRAAFKAVEFGKQAAVLVPTTVLAEQHERTFKARFADYPFVVASVSRFKTDAEIKETLDRLGKGQIDVLIGTHRLISQDVRFADLGLVVIDEEQRFGVEHKEKLLALRMTVDVLTLSATPIPRTLHMSLLGLRDISSLTTAPMERRAVVTEVIPYNEKRIEQAIRRELARDGQVFFVHNRVHNIQSVADDVRRLVPEARIVVGHGQMSPGELEEVMLKFMRGQADILVSTTIIESGIDIPSANTMIIADADRFGLADLHQLRGRVGRSKNRGYCYLLLPDSRPVKERAKQRLKAIEQYSMLGAGFKIAMRDLEIRGAGNILGPEQSGHIAAVGYDMYCSLLERSVKELRNEVTATPSETSVEIGVRGVIPKTYIPSDTRRLEAYRRLALAGSSEEIEKVRRDLIGAYGSLPDTTERLLQLAEVRAGSRHLGVRTISVKGKDVIISTVDPVRVAEAMEGAPGRTTALPIERPGEAGQVYFRPDNPAALEPATLLAILRKRLAGAKGPDAPAPPGAAPPAPGIKVYPAPAPLPKPAGKPKPIKPAPTLTSKGSTFERFRRITKPKT